MSCFKDNFVIENYILTLDHSFLMEERRKFKEFLTGWFLLNTFKLKQ